MFLYIQYVIALWQATFSAQNKDSFIYMCMNIFVHKIKKKNNGTKKQQ